MSAKSFCFGMKTGKLGERGYFSFGLGPDENWLREKFDSKSKDAPNKGGKKDSRETHDSFEQESQLFFEQMIAYLDVLPLAVKGMPVARIALLQKHIDSNVKPISSRSSCNNNVQIYELPRKYFGTISRTTKSVRRQMKSIESLKSVFLLGLVSSYDEFVGHLVRVLAKKKPHTLLNSDRQFSVKEIFDYSTFEEFQNQILESEVEAVLRKSHEDQLNWFEKKTNVELRKGIKCWPDFIEVFERRNLFAHSGGRVTATYLSKCSKAGKKDLPEIGNKLEITPTYLYDATQVLLEVGIKLAQVLSRTCDTGETNADNANAVLQEQSFELLFHEHYQVARSLLDFASKDYSPGSTTRIYHDR